MRQTSQPAATPPIDGAGSPVQELAQAQSVEPESVLADLVRVAAKALHCELAVAYCPDVPVQARRGGPTGAIIADRSLDGLMDELWREQARHTTTLATLATLAADRFGPTAGHSHPREIVPIGNPAVGLLLVVHGADNSHSPHQRHALALLLTEVADAKLQQARRDPNTGLANQLGWKESCARAQLRIDHGESAGILLLEIDDAANGPTDRAARADDRRHAARLLLELEATSGPGDRMLLDLAPEAHGAEAGHGGGRGGGADVEGDAGARWRSGPRGPRDLRRVAALARRAVGPLGVAALIGPGTIAVLLTGASEATTRAVASGLQAQIGPEAIVGIGWVSPRGALRNAEREAAERLQLEKVCRTRQRRSRLHPSGMTA